MFCAKHSISRCQYRFEFTVCRAKRLKVILLFLSEHIDIDENEKIRIELNRTEPNRDF